MLRHPQAAAMTRAKLHWYKRNPRDWLDATRELSLEERGAYNDLLELMYLRDRPIPDEPVFISGFLRIHRHKWTRIREALLDAGRLVVHGDYITDERFERDRNISQEYRQQAVTWGKKGGKARANQAARDDQGQFAGFGPENGSFPPVASKGSLGKPAPKATPMGNEEKSEQYQGPSPRVALDDLDDSFLHENAQPHGVSGGGSEGGSGGGKGGETHPLNGSFPTPSSRPARVARAGARVQKEVNNVRDSSRKGGAGGTVAPRKKAATAKRIPKDWEPEQPTADVAEFLATWPPGMLDRERVRFIDHANANGRTLKDWDAGFRNWLRKADDDRNKQLNRERGQGWSAVAHRVAGQVR
jgi:uncharacterized protein YdaU (DUF1376 family)